MSIKIEDIRVITNFADGEFRHEARVIFTEESGMRHHVVADGKTFFSSCFNALSKVEGGHNWRVIFSLIVMCVL